MTKVKKLKLDSVKSKNLHNHDITTFFNSNAIHTENWINKETLLVYNTSKNSSEKIASFDLDGTIITTKSGKVFPINEDDWRINALNDKEANTLCNKIRTAHKDGFKVVIFTNQKGIIMNKSGMSIDKFKRKIQAIISYLGDIACVILVSISDDIYRKPNIGMWQYLQSYLNDDVIINKEKSFYVGDAAGRPDFHFRGHKYKKDHSSTDRLFALNIGLGKFYTPEEYFFGMSEKEVPHTLPSFSPKKYLAQQAISDNSFIKKLILPLNSSFEEIIVMVGCPGSGKSFVANRINQLADKRYTIINLDTLKSKAKCEKMCEQVLSNQTINGKAANKCLLIDNTNPTIEARKSYLEMAQKHDLPIRCIWLTTAHDQCLHNERYRRMLKYCATHWATVQPFFNEYIQEGSEEEKLLLSKVLEFKLKDHANVPEMVFNIYRSKFQEPSKDEGFHAIIKCNFVPMFTTQFETFLYGLYL